MKKCLCIFTGLPRGYAHDEYNIHQNIYKNLILHNADNFTFKYIVCTEGASDEIQMIQQKLNIPYDDIIVYNKDEHNIKVNSSTQIYLIRLYKCLQKEENNTYDIYINLRFDIILEKPLDLNNYLDKYCIMTPFASRPCSFHNKDWDLMCIGDNFNYKLYMYPFINNVLTNFYNENIIFLKDNCINTNLDNHNITNEEIIEINKLCGLITEEPVILFSVILKFFLKNGGNFILNENNYNMFL